MSWLISILGAADPNAVTEDLADSILTFKIALSSHMEMKPCDSIMIPSCPACPQKGPWQTVQTKIRHHRTWHLIWIYIHCLLEKDTGITKIKRNLRHTFKSARIAESNGYKWKNFMPFLSCLKLFWDRYQVIMIVPLLLHDIHDTFSVNF